MKNLAIIIAIIIAATINVNANGSDTVTNNDDKKKAKTEKATMDNTEVSARNSSSSAIVGAFGEFVVIKETTKINNKIGNGFYRKAKALPTGFNGYAIQITTSMEGLDVNDKLFAEFGNLLVEEALNPKFCYIVGSFRTKVGAEKYMNTIIGNRYPNAKVLKYKEGVRVKVK